MEHHVGVVAEAEGAVLGEQLHLQGQACPVPDHGPGKVPVLDEELGDRNRVGRKQRLPVGRGKRRTRRQALGEAGDGVRGQGFGLAYALVLFGPVG